MRSAAGSVKPLENRQAYPSDDLQAGEVISSCFRAHSSTGGASIDFVERAIPRILVFNKLQPHDAQSERQDC
jgi:hypothetical protein